MANDFEMSDKVRIRVLNAEIERLKVVLAESAIETIATMRAEIERLTGGARVVSRDLLFRYIRDGSDTVPVVALREAVAEIERLTARIMAERAQAVQVERERCAKIADDHAAAKCFGVGGETEAMRLGARSIAAAIREGR